MSWDISAVWDAIVDFFSGSGSEARKIAEMYEKAEKDLGEKISELKEKLETLEDIRFEKYNNYLNGGGTAEGDILNEFERAVAAWNNKYNNMLMCINNGLTVLVLRQSLARQLKEYYEAIAKAEEMNANG